MKEKHAEILVQLTFLAISTIAWGFYCAALDAPRWAFGISLFFIVIKVNALCNEVFKQDKLNR